MKILITTVCGYPDMDIMKAIYHNRENYQLYDTEVIPIKYHDRPHSWSKIKIIQNRIKNYDYDYIMWLDADALIANQLFDIARLIQPDYDFFYTTDINGFNGGSFIVRSCDLIYDALQKAWDMTDYINHIWWEQIPLWKSVNETGCRLCELPKKSINSYPNDFTPGDFILHFPGVPNKFETIKKLSYAIS